MYPRISEIIPTYSLSYDGNNNYFIEIIFGLIIFYGI